MRRFNRRIPRRYLLPLRILAFGLLALVVVPATWALATATVGDAANQAALTALYYPTAAAGVASGHSQSLTWTLASPNNGNGSGIMALKQAAGTTCPTTLASYEPAAANWVSGVAAATAAYTDSGSVYAYDANYEGGIACYLIHSGYNPGGAQHGYLWWLAWLNHSARTLFSVQDGNGVFRPLFLQASCATLAQIVNSVAGSETILNLTPILTNLNLCPTQAAADIRAYRAYQQGKSTSSSAAGPRSAGGSGSTASSSTSGLFLPKLPTK
jgi:hypothetical protein